MGKYRSDGESLLRDDAWIGDSILSLYLRQLLIANQIGPASVRAEAFKYFSSNAFLNGFGRPTAMEAEIGKVYLSGGVSAAFEFINEKYLPVIKRQVHNRCFSDERIVINIGLKGGHLSELSLLSSEF